MRTFCACTRFSSIMYLACVGVCACAACASFGVDFRAPIWGKTILGAGLGIACAPVVLACVPVVPAEVGFELGSVLCALSAAGVLAPATVGASLLAFFCALSLAMRSLPRFGKDESDPDNSRSRSRSISRSNAAACSVSPMPDSDRSSDDKSAALPLSNSANCAPLARLFNCF